MVETMRSADITHAAHGPRPRKAETPEGVALELLEMIYAGEVVKPTREEILSTYAECLRTVIENGRAFAPRPKKRAVAPMGDELAASRPSSVERLDDETV